MKLRVDALPEVQYGPWLKSDDRISSFLDTHNWQRKCIFWELSYWKTLFL